jgi:hypothetical protein
MARLTWLNIIASVSISFLIPQCRALAMQDGVPHFNIERTCREARTYAGADKEVAYKGCLKDETDAREQLAQKWTSFKAADRRDCVMQGAAPMPSYVELLTCLEMSAEVEALDAPVGVRANKTRGSPRQTSSEPAPGLPPGDTPAPPLKNGTLPKPK